MALRTLPSGTLWNLTDDQLDDILERCQGRMPRIFVTGDGHREPPFGWIARCRSDELRNHFEKLVRAGMLCAHVEEYEHQVSIRSVPRLLQRLHGQGRIFGWELEVYRFIQPVMEEYRRFPSLWEEMKIPRLRTLDANIREVHERRREIGEPTSLTNLYQKWTNSRSHGPEFLQAFLQKYSEAVEQLRTSVGTHRAISGKINHVISTFPGRTHLITCGNEHLNRQNCQIALDGFIQPRDGVVDASDGWN